MADRRSWKSSSSGRSSWSSSRTPSEASWKGDEEKSSETLHGHLSSYVLEMTTPNDVNKMSLFMSDPGNINVHPKPRQTTDHAVLRESLVRDAQVTVEEETTLQSFTAFLKNEKVDHHGGLRNSLTTFLKDDEESKPSAAKMKKSRSCSNFTDFNPELQAVAVRKSRMPKSASDDIMMTYRNKRDLFQNASAQLQEDSRKDYQAWLAGDCCSVSSETSSVVDDCDHDQLEVPISSGSTLSYFGASNFGSSPYTDTTSTEVNSYRDMLKEAEEDSPPSALRVDRKKSSSPAPIDASTEEASSKFSTEDRDFVTPWYTYVMRALMPFLGILIFYFIYWRLYNYPRSHIWWSDMCAYIFIFSESICFLFGMTHWVWMWNLKFRKRVTQEELNLRDEDLPTIDIMIPCYSEPTEIVEMTLKACYDMDYPAEKITCWVCDDGKKEAMKNMVARVAEEYKGEMKTRYVARMKYPGVPHHAKAGNLNNCILKEDSAGQLIMILDCDMLPEPCFARTVAPFFYKKLAPDERYDDEEGRRVAEYDYSTGLLQTPQAFYNLDTNDLLGQSYAFFYECFMSGWDGTGCTPCCGTGVTFSRYALTQVGGFSTGSITEDFKTSLNLCANGFKCKFFLQRMTRGVSPKDLEAYMVQRMRWAVGAIQIFRAGNPLFIKGLHARARWLYFFSTVGIVYIIPVCMMGIIMYTTILVGAPISFGPTTFVQYLVIGGTAVALMMIMQLLAGWRISKRDYLRALQDNFTVFWTLIRAIMTGFLGLELGFVVTSKENHFDLMANLRHARPHIIIYIYSGAAMVKGTTELLSSYGLFSIPWTTGYNVSLLYFSMMWTVFLWVMISAPPRMVLYGWRRSRREASNPLKCENNNVPALQELPVTPMNTFPPLKCELWENIEVEVAASHPTIVLPLASIEEGDGDMTTPTPKVGMDELRSPIKSDASTPPPVSAVAPLK